MQVSFPGSLIHVCNGMNDADFGYSKGHPWILGEMNRMIEVILEFLRQRMKTEQIQQLILIIGPRGLQEQAPV
jgi:hypothetical protein